MELASEYQEKTTFICHHGLYRFMCMLVSVKNIPGLFQRGMDIILLSVQWKHALVNLYDIIVFYSIVTAHLAHFAGIHHLLKKAGMSIKLKE